MKTKEWLGENNTLGLDIWKNKYQYNNETFDEWVERISAGNKDIAKLIKEKKFLFGGRILANRGLENSLVAIINAHKDKEAELKEKFKAEEATLMADMAAQEEALNSDIKELEKKKEDLIAATKAEHDELKKELDKQRKREAEEYNYDLKRARQLEEDKWTDEKNAREKELTEREAVVRADEQELAEKTAYIEELEQKVEEIPTLVQEATEEGVKKGKVDADKSNAFEVRALKQKNDYDVQILEDKVNRLELEVDSLRNEKADLQMKLDDAYAQMRDLAAETVKSTGGVKILNGQNSQLSK